MATINQLKNEIEDSNIFKDIADVLSGIATRNYQNLNKSKRNNKFFIDTYIDVLENKILTIENFPTQKSDINLTLVLGSDQGFCGNFNSLLADEVSAIPFSSGHLLFVQGKKLQSKLQNRGIKFESFSKIDFQNFNIQDNDSINKIIDKIFNIKDNDSRSYSRTNLTIIYASLLQEKKIVIDKHPDIFQKISSILTYSRNYKKDLKTENIDFSNQWEVLNQKIILEPETDRETNNFDDYFRAEELFTKHIFSAYLLHSAFHSELTENYTRMKSMNEASENINEIIKDLEMSLRRKRQDKITRELVEIISAANAYDDFVI